MGRQLLQIPENIKSMISHSCVYFDNLASRDNIHLQIVSNTKVNGLFYIEKLARIKQQRHKYTVKSLIWGASNHKT